MVGEGWVATSGLTLRHLFDSLLSGFMRKKSRLFALAEALRGRRTGVTAQQLADRFGVTIRTIYRDLDALQDAGLPLRADRGRGGGYALDKAYQLPPINLTAREGALLVALGKMALDQRLLPFTAPLEAALDKVRGALTTSAQRELLRLVDHHQIVRVPRLPVPATGPVPVEAPWFRGPPASPCPPGDWAGPLSPGSPPPGGSRSTRRPGTFTAAPNSRRPSASPRPDMLVAMAMTRPTANTPPMPITTVLPCFSMNGIAS